MKFYKINENQRSIIQCKSLSDIGFGLNKFHVDNDPEEQKFANKESLIVAILANKSINTSAGKLTIVAMGRVKQVIYVIETSQDYEKINNNTHVIYIVPQLDNFILAEDQIVSAPKKPALTSNPWLKLNLYGKPRRRTAEQKTSSSVTGQPTKTTNNKTTIADSTVSTFFNSLSMFFCGMPDLQANLFKTLRKKPVVAPANDSKQEDFPTLQLDEMGGEEQCDFNQATEDYDENTALAPSRQSFSS